MHVEEDLDIKLKDGKLTGITHNVYCGHSGCPTCGYGAEYTTELEFRFSNSKHNIYAELSPDEISLGTIIMLLYNNIKKMESMTQDECSAFIKRELKLDKERGV